MPDRITASRLFPLALFAGALAGIGGVLPARGAAPADDAGALRASALRTNHMREPLGIATSAPSFSWVALARRRDTLQSAYEIQVTDRDRSDHAQASWSSGWVRSDRQTGVVYQGPPLHGRSRYTWRVRIRDNHGDTSPWSRPAHFETALGEAAAWQAHWITDDRVLPKLSGKDKPPPPTGSLPLMRKDFSTHGRILRARLYASALGVYQLRLNGHAVGHQRLAPGWTDYHRRLDYQTYDVTGLLHEGDNTLAAMLAPGWYAGHVSSFGTDHYGKQLALLVQLRLDYADGHHALAGC